MTEEEQQLRDLLAKVAEEAGIVNYREMARAIIEAGYRLNGGLDSLHADAQCRSFKPLWLRWLR